MSHSARAMLVAVVLGALILPLATAHTIFPMALPHEEVEHEAGDHLDLLPLLALTVLSTLPLVGLVRGAARWRSAHRRLCLLTRGGVPLTSGAVAYVRLPGEQVALFTAGLLHSVVYATVGAERVLRPEAFHAALLHEQAHVQHHDVQWLALAALAEAAASSIPGSRDAFRSLRIETEWLADRTALDAGVGRHHLFEAIVGAAGGTAGAAALSGVGTTERLRWLADGREDCPVAERSMVPVLAGLSAPPMIAHALLWTGLICAICLQHFR